jgi:ParB/RepB/Spo0J family partition protein
MPSKAKPKSVGSTLDAVVAKQHATMVAQYGSEAAAVAVEQLIDDAATAVDEIDADELEAYANEHRAPGREIEEYPDPDLNDPDFDPTRTELNYKDAEPEQLHLIPDEIPPGRFDIIDLRELPDDVYLPSPEPTRGMVESVKRYGVLEPIIVVDLGFGNGWKVLAGRRRIKAARQAELETITALIYEEGFDYSEIVTIAENHHRKPNPVADLMALRALMQRGASDEEICAATSWTKTDLKARRPLLNLYPPLLAALEEGRISATVGIAASKRSQADQVVLYGVLEDNGKLTIGDVQDVRKAGGRDAFTEALADMFGDEEDDGLTLVESQHWLDRVMAHIEAADRIFPAHRTGTRLHMALLEIKKLIRDEMNQVEVAEPEEEDDEVYPYDPNGMSRGDGWNKGD